MNLNSIKPFGLHVTGVIRFASENRGTDQFRQLDHFEVLGRSYEQPGEDGQAPNLKPHPICSHLQPQTSEDGSAQSKLRSIPVKVIFNDPANVLTARFEAFDGQLNRLACVGDGENCSRADFATGKVNQMPCAGPDACEFANSGAAQCQLKVRMTVQIEGQEDPLSVFEVQSSGIHTYRTLSAKLAALHAVTDGKLRGVPLMLVEYERGSPAHGFLPFYVADLQLRDGSLEAAKQAAEDATQGAEEALFKKLEETVATMRQQAPFATDDDTDTGVVFTRAATPVPAPRRQRAAEARVSGSSATPPASSISAVIARVKGTASEPAAEVVPAATPVVGIVLQPDCGMSTTPHTGAAAVAETSEFPLTGATINGTREIPATPL